MNKKKVIIIVDDFIHNSQKSAPVLIKDLAIAINNNESYSAIVIAPNHRSKDIKRLEIKSIDTILFPSGKLKNVNLVLRFFNEFMLSYRLKKCYPFLLNEEVVGIIYYSPSIFFGNAIDFLKQKFRCSSYLILRDLFPQWLVDVGILRKNGIIHSVLKHFEKVNLKSADKVGVMSKANLKLFSNKIDYKKYEILSNWVSSDIITKKTNCLENYGLENISQKFTFFYGGNIGLAQNINVLLDLADSLSNKENIHFIFIGQGDAVGLIKNCGLSNVKYIKSLNQAEYFKLASNFDVGIFSLDKNHTAHNFPGKLYGYMSMSKPIIGIVNNGNDVKELINFNNAGLVCNYDEGISSLKSHCIKLSKKSDLYVSQSMNSQNLISNFSPENAANQILSFFKKNN